MSIRKASTADLRAELARREDRQRERDRKKLLAWAEEHRCPDCGELPDTRSLDAVEEYRFAPRDSDGRPMIYAPYEMGTTQGMRYEETATCPNGHTYFVDEHIKWFDKPFSGPPMLGRGA